MAAELTDAQLFGPGRSTSAPPAPPPKELSDADLFGAKPAAPTGELSDAELFSQPQQPEQKDLISRMRDLTVPTPSGIFNKVVSSIGADDKWGQVIKSLPTQFVEGGRLSVGGLMRGLSEGDPNEALPLSLKKPRRLNKAPEGSIQANMDAAASDEEKQRMAQYEEEARKNPAGSLIYGMRDTGRSMTDQAREALKNATPKDMTFWQEAATTAARSLGIAIPGLVASAATRSPAPALAAMGLGEFGSSFDENIRSGMSPEKARQASIMSAGVEAYTEVIPLNKLLSLLPKKGLSIFKKMAMMYLPEIAQENLATLGQDAIQFAAQNPGATFKDWYEGYIKKIPEQAARTTASTILSSTVQTGAAQAAHSLTNVGKDKSQPATATGELSDAELFHAKPRSVETKQTEEPAKEKPLYSRTGEDKTAVDVFEAIASKEQNVQFKTSEARDFKDVTKELAGGQSWQVVPRGDNQISLLVPKSTDTGAEHTEFMRVYNANTDKPHVTIGDPEEKGRGGAKAYQIAMTWAHNNDKTLVPDTVLTVINRLRRTEAMISSALRHKTTRHVEPHPDQYVGLLPKEDYAKLKGESTTNPISTSAAGVQHKLLKLKEQLWTPESPSNTPAQNREIYRSNVYNLIRASSELAHRRYRRLNAFTMDKEGKVYDALTGRTYDDLSKAPQSKTEINRGIGSTTRLRAVVARSFLRQEGEVLRGSERSAKPVQPVRTGTVHQEGVLENRRQRGVLAADDLERIAQSPAVRKSLYSRQKKQGRLSKESVERTIAPVVSKWRNGPKVVVVQSTDEIPNTAAPHDVEGAYVGNNTIYLVADNLDSHERVLQVLAHEAVGHAAVEDLFGRDLDTILKGVRYLARTNARVRAIAQQVDETQPGLDEVTRAKEIIAVMAEQGIHNSLINRVISAIQRFLRSLGINIELNINDLADLLRAAERHLETGVVESGADTQVAYSKQAPIWYSALERGINAAKQTKATAKDWKAIVQKLPGVKQDEIDAVGLNEWLDLQTGQVTREQVMEFVRQNGVQVNEKVQGGDLQSNLESAEKAVVDQGQQEHMTRNGAKDYALDAARGTLSDSQKELMSDAMRPLVARLREAYVARERRKDGESQTKFHAYQLPGGENYRELLLTLPQKHAPVSLPDIETWVKQQPWYLAWEAQGKNWDKANSLYLQWAEREERSKQKDRFYSSHFDEPNILAHVRFNERTDADGKRVLFIEEVQSDWAQKGRKEGFRTSKQDEQQAAYNRYVAEGMSAFEAMEKAEAEFGSGRIPAAPFVTKTESWAMLAMKRMIRYAAENGFERVAWDQGHAQAERYDLSKEVSRVIFTEHDRLLAYDLDGNKVIDEGGVTEEKLSDYIGKDAAEKISAMPWEHEGVKTKTLTGVDLKVGGEGMTGFYNGILPNVVNKYVKRFGARTKETRLAETAANDKWPIATEVAQGKRPVNSIEITDSMREAVMAGQPLFSRKDQTQTPEFKKWFGDSKVVDENGKPLVVYHSSVYGDFDAFDKTEQRAGMAGFGFYFSDQEGSNIYAQHAATFKLEKSWSGEQKKINTMPVYLAMRKPLVVDNMADVAKRFGGKDGEAFGVSREIAGISDNARTAVQRAGYDGVISNEYVRAKKNGSLEVVSPNAKGAMKHPVYVVFEPTQIKSAIGNRGTFDPNSPNILYSRRKEVVIGNSGRKYTKAQMEAMKATGSVMTESHLAEVIKDAWTDIGKKMTQGIVDQFAPVKNLSKNAYMLLRLSKGATGAFEAFMNYGKLSITSEGVYDADTSGGVMQKVFIPLGKETTDFLRWIAGNRAERLMNEGREHLFSQEHIDAFKSLSEGQTDFDYHLSNGQTTRSRRAIYQDSLNKFNAFNKNVLDIAEQSGLIDSESRHLWENEFYVPFYRVEQKDGGIRGMNIKSGVVRQEAFKRLKGGKEQLNDLLMSTLMNWSHLVDASAKNRAARATILAAEKAGLARRANSGDKDTVWFMGRTEQTLPDGRSASVFMKNHYQINDPYLLTAISSLEYAGMRNPAMKALQSFKHWLTIGVTASPFFKVRNLIRDSMQAIATSDLSYNVLGNIATGVMATRKGTQEYTSALAAGGLIRFGTMLEGNETERTRHLIAKGASEEQILDNQSKIETFLDKTLYPAVAAYNELGNRGEEINRMALYRQMVAKGIPQGEAALMARDLMDFSMSGAWNSIRFLTQVVPFMNARLQGLYKLGRSARENSARFTTVVGATALVSIALLLAYKDDDDWKRREDWDRDNYWWFKFGGLAYRIPKPFEIGAIASLAERSVELWISDEMTRKRFLSRIANILGDQLAMNPTPQLVKPIIDLYSNKDSFTGRPIEPMGMERLKKDYRFTANTSMFARAVSTGTGGKILSPIQIDHLIRGYFGWLGTFVTYSGDLIARPFSGDPSRPSPDYIKKLTGGMVQGLEGAPSRYVTQIYDQAKALEEAYATYVDLLKKRKREEAAEFKKDNLADIKMAPYVEAMKRAMSGYNMMIRQIEINDKLAPDEKQRKIDEIKQRKHIMAKRFDQRLRDMESRRER